MDLTDTHYKPKWVPIAYLAKKYLVDPGLITLVISEHNISTKGQAYDDHCQYNYFGTDHEIGIQEIPTAYWDTGYFDHAQGFLFRTTYIPFGGGPDLMPILNGFTDVVVDREKFEDVYLPNKQSFVKRKHFTKMFIEQLYEEIVLKFGSVTPTDFIQYLVDNQEDYVEIVSIDERDPDTRKHSIALSSATGATRFLSFGRAMNIVSELNSRRKASCH